MIKKTLFVILAIISASALAGCAGDGHTALLEICSPDAVRIVRSEDSNDDILRASLTICDTISAKTGFDMHVVTDFSCKQDADDGCPEILVGMTSRPESIEVYKTLPDENCFVIRTVNNKIVIAGTTDSIVCDAADYFISNYMNTVGKTLFVAGTIDYVNSEYSFFDIARGETAYCDFVIPDDASECLTDMVEFVAKKLNDVGGSKIQVLKRSQASESENIITVECAETGSLNLISDHSYSVKFSDGRISVLGDNESTALCALGELYCYLLSTTDTLPNGDRYLFFRKSMVLSGTWNYNTPGFPGAFNFTYENVSSGNGLIICSGADKDAFGYYVKLLEATGFVIDSCDLNNTKSLSVSATRSSDSFRIDASCSFASDTVKIRIYGE